MLNLWLDKKVPPPRLEWTWVKNARDCERLLRDKNNSINALSVGTHYNTSFNGTSLLEWLLFMCRRGLIYPPRDIFIHSKDDQEKTHLEHFAREIRTFTFLR